MTHLQIRILRTKTVALFLWHYRKFVSVITVGLRRPMSPLDAVDRPVVLLLVTNLRSSSI